MATDGGKPQTPCEGVLIFVSRRVGEPLGGLSGDVIQSIIGSSCLVALGRKD